MVHFFASALLILGMNEAYAWGSRGHHTLCQASTHLVKNPELRRYLIARSHQMGHLCLLPDIQWRLGVPENRYSHYLVLETWKGPKGVPKTFGHDHPSIGSLWWRSEQLFDLAVGQQGTWSEDRFKHFFSRIGLMGHYIGDASATVHLVRDYDGKKVGRPGLHEYFETELVNTFGPDLLSLMVKRAQEIKLPAFEDVRAAQVYLAEAAWSERDELDALDKQAWRKTKRVAAEESDQAYRNLALRQMARGAAVLASLWDEAYVKLGKPDLSKARITYIYEVPYIPADYAGENKKGAEAPSKN